MWVAGGRLGGHVELDRPARGVRCDGKGGLCVHVMVCVCACEEKLSRPRRVFDECRAVGVSRTEEGNHP